MSCLPTARLRIEETYEMPANEARPDRSEHRQAAGAVALNVIVATGSDTRGECNMPKCTLARHSQLALTLRPEYRR